MVKMMTIVETSDDSGEKHAQLFHLYEGMNALGQILETHIYMN
jgi:hypothetical protein